MFVFYKVNYTREYKWRNIVRCVLIHAIRKCVLNAATANALNFLNYFWIENAFRSLALYRGLRDRREGWLSSPGKI